MIRLPRLPRTARRRAVALAAALLVLAGCAGRVPPPLPVGATDGLPRVAFLPLENLTRDAGAGDRMSRVFYGALAATGTCEIVEAGDVEAAYREMRIRTTGMLTSAQAVAIAQRLRARWLVTGTILEYGMVRTTDGEMPSVGVTLRMLDGRDARVTWNAMKVAGGQDRETVFGWGREASLDRLAERTARELFRGFALPAAAGDSVTGGQP